MRFLATAGASVALMLICSVAFAQNTKIDLKLDNGTVLIYKARAAGYSERLKLNVVRDGAVVGTVEIIRMLPAYAQAKILTGADAVRELDDVMPVGVTPIEEASKLSVGAPKMQPASAKEEAVAAPVKSKRAVHSVEVVPESNESASATPPAAASGGTTSSSRRSSRRSETEAAPAKTAPTSETPKAVQPKIPAAVSENSPFVFQVGLFFLEQTIPEIEASADPALMLGVDYWSFKKKSSGFVHSFMYSKPVMKFEYGGRQVRYQFEIMQFSINYIWTDLYSKNAGETGLYGGFGAGYRSASMHANCDISCDGISHAVSNSFADTDFHAMLGYRFNRKYELKLDYSIDEEYFGVTFGLVGKKKRLPPPPVIVEAKPAPKPVVAAKPKPKPAPVIVEEPEPEPEAPEIVIEPEPKVEEPVIIIVSEPKVERKVIAIVSEPKFEEMVIVLALEDINFEFDSSTLTKEAQAILKRNIRILIENPKAKVRIAGYTSASGTDEYNQKLSERRAKAVKDYLIKEGLIATGRLVTIGYGESNPETYEVAPKDLYSPAAKSNMRVLFEIVVK